MPRFELQATVHENVRALRRALGSVTTELSRDDLAALITERHRGGRKPNGSTIQRWEIDTEPDTWSILVMADLAGVTFEHFALGRVYSVASFIKPDTPPTIEIIEGPARGDVSGGSNLPLVKHYDNEPAPRHRDNEPVPRPPKPAGKKPDANAAGAARRKKGKGR